MYLIDVQAWSSLAFQAQGHAKQLEPGEAYGILKAMCKAGVLARRATELNDAGLIGYEHML